MTALRPFVRRYFPRLLGLSGASRSGRKYRGNNSKSQSQQFQLDYRIRENPPDFSNGSNQYSTTLKIAGDNDSQEYILPWEVNNVDGIMRVVECEVRSEHANSASRA